ncbi:hypothetical protein COT50_01000 [candidate division WWE3 bacterium CG08_land_8_20_14_0_20_41_10]|uniref:Fido domain-containing protein n=1 Tax=candidate division WWE3 bacterium CG08_land_8_20_14_0_20_41_10 TaxID=1975085 RepID=A0A2H0XCD9_UNCKA|nr:MAG: hypothetical protein COT50_01000 [candidate division WWE3 bacterium CG08_land_8_20_14_0_20_41_10]
MFLPEYTITNKILKNIALVEYAKALAENTPILPTVEESIQKEATIALIKSIGMDMGKDFAENQIKMAVDGLLQVVPADLANVVKVVLTTSFEPEEYTNTRLKLLYQGLVGEQDINRGLYRSQKIPKYTNPEEILADTVELMDWCQSVDALETHPIIFAGVLRARLEVLSVFEAYNSVVSNLFTRMALRWRTYNLKNFFKYEVRYLADKQSYQKAIYAIFKDDGDLTTWLEYFSEVLSYDAMDIKEKVTLGERQTKTAVAQGLTDLTERQSKIVQYLSNYGIMLNKDFALLFPAISEDSVLRDLKTLIDRGVIIKVGSTKSSKYKLK